ncbi:uroporphyrinogen-III C-methyltransferase [Rubrivivax albus]|uniref:uroporphyrinogen-III C-methyltransferase n=1 Tax=Rubrivivax albus TaxID=2499835 RepID=A0A437JXI8_9BURK|nr:uroporphyrinogen-III C-methyltransferase [Rubrivivax albus]RVT52403.1 uroporphyrinogen-III C-methyltransferase [Rubrivivax albus]
MNRMTDFDALLARVQLPANAPPATGRVALVGAGPGDPELLTVKAARLLAACDVVVYDALVGGGVMDLVPGHVERRYVGKQRANHSLSQDQINSLLVALARQGKRVVRLKGGDPFVFGRGGEELQALAEAGVPYEVVPGITAACGVSAHAGIPLTHRDFAQGCLIVTGHLKDGSCNLDWPALARPKQTTVIYMGLAGLPEICAQLIAHGLPATHPAGVVEQGTLPGQRVVTGTLADLPQRVAEAGLKSPCLTIVGEVVSLHGTLAWFGQREATHGTDLTDHATSA